MSICNVWVERDHALIGVDTAAMNPSDNGKQFVAQKMFPLPHLGCILAGRGNAALIGCVAMMLAAVPGEKNSSRLQMTLYNAAEVAFAELREKIDLAIADELVVVGYCEEFKAMRGIFVTRESGRESFAGEPMGPHYIAPWHPSLDAVPDPIDEPGMLGLGMAQVNMIAAELPKMRAVVGGSMIFARVTKDRMDIRDLGPLD